MMDPNKRITSEHAMQDPYFLEDPLPTPEYVINVYLNFFHTIFMTIDDMCLLVNVVFTEYY